VVKAISTKHDASTTTVTRRKRGGGVVEEVSKPTCIVDYNKQMSGVDGLDQMISYYPFNRKSLKWTTKVFFYLMEISVTALTFCTWRRAERRGTNTCPNSCCNS